MANNSLTKNNNPKRKLGKLVETPTLIDIKPAISITYLQQPYGMKHFYRCIKCDAEIIKIFNEFLEQVKLYSNIDELIKSHSSKYKTKNSDKYSLKTMEQISDKYNIETYDMIHLHCKKGGKGAFVLHGFRINNRFEIVWIDPKHDIHK